MLERNTSSVFRCLVGLHFLSIKNIQKHELVTLKIVEIIHKSSDKNKRNFVADLLLST